MTINEEAIKAKHRELGLAIAGGFFDRAAAIAETISRFAKPTDGASVHEAAIEIKRHELNSALIGRYWTKARALLENIGRLVDASNGAQLVPMTPISETLSAAVDRAERRHDGRETAAPVPWPEFAKALGGGYWPGMHMLIGGTGAGKSQVALQIALHAAQQGCATTYVGLELDPDQVSLRVSGTVAGVSWSDADRGKAGPQETKLLRNAEMPKGLYQTTARAGTWSVTELRALAAAMRAAHPDPSVPTKENPKRPLVIIVDYLQVLGGGDGAERADMRERISAAANAAQGVAIEFNAAVLLVSSVAREHYRRVGGDKALADAGLELAQDGELNALAHPEEIVGTGKESGDIEYAGVTVTILARCGFAEKKDPAGQTRLVLAVAKNRTAAPGWCELRSNGWRVSDSPDNGRALIAERRQQTAANGKGSSAGATSKAATGSTLESHDDVPDVFSVRVPNGR
jgi:replicative DNA helicase